MPALNQDLNLYEQYLLRAVSGIAEFVDKGLLDGTVRKLELSQVHQMSADPLVIARLPNLADLRNPDNGPEHFGYELLIGAPSRSAVTVSRDLATNAQSVTAFRLDFYPGYDIFLTPKADDAALLEAMDLSDRPLEQVMQAVKAAERSSVITGLTGAVYGALSFALSPLPTAFYQMPEQVYQRMSSSVNLYAIVRRETRPSAIKSPLLQLPGVAGRLPRVVTNGNSNL